MPYCCSKKICLTKSTCILHKNKKHSRNIHVIFSKKKKYPCNYLSFDYDGMARPLDITQTNDGYTDPTE